jgi:hypothetical protein
MCRAIAAAHSVDEVKDIHDKALAIEIYSRQARNIENEKRAIEIRIRAERRCGELLKEIKGQLKQGNELPRSDGATTATLLRPRHQQRSTFRWQKLAAVPPDEFETTFARPEKTGDYGDHHCASVGSAKDGSAKEECSR